ncbi:MAG: hypothetical protein ABR525_02820 [Candidatus Limnocylindria bacterium]
MNIERKGVMAALVAGSMLAGAAIGATALRSTTAAAAGTTDGRHAIAAGGTFTPNEDPAHEATESAEREAQEDAGQVPTAP